jgi:hypothetical protein
MVYRYQELLREDPDLSGKLTQLRVSPRRVLPFAVGALCLTLFALATFIHDMIRIVPLIFGCAVALGMPMQLLKERRIVQGWSASVGTVVSRWKAGRSGKRSRFGIKYAFRAADQQIYLGQASGGAGMPKNGAPLAIIYRSDNPSRSLPVSQFMFHEFSYSPQFPAVNTALNAGASQGQSL